MEQLKICIVEDDPEFQEWILEELQEDQRITCLSRHLTGEDALAVIPIQKPDIVIMDLTLKKSKYDGIECMLRLNLEAPEIQFLVISSHSDEGKIFEALKVGAGAYIQKEDIPRKLTDLLFELHAGGAPMSPGIARRVINSMRLSTDNLELLARLSKREWEVLEQLSKGFLYKEIADILGIAKETVRNHAHRIYKKLHVNNRTEAIRKYLRK